ncbi:S8 family serine peptidase [Clostridium sp. 19966]|uniref:S8 family serine peptidase n=1 Tax=Clostridium sp. 19966 TaxID=2768166 RepID=UPI0028DDC159|nr:S8 family serine peptidase [Clostridium sp. 19966]MDT8715130.1 S8 family serine peptidase [Clostridium sp. 19966]
MKKKFSHKLLSKFASSFLALSLLFTLLPEKAMASSLSDEELKTKLIQAMMNQQSNYKLNSYAVNKYGKALDENKSAKDSDENKLTRVIIQFNQAPAVSKINSKDSKTLKSSSSQNIEQAVKKQQGDIIDKIQSITKTKVIRSFGYLINGISIQVKKSDIPKLSVLDGVKSVTEVQSFTPSMESSNEITQAYNVWKDYGYKGNGMVVSVIDTGIDYTHKDLQNIDKSNLKLTEKTVEEKINSFNHGKYFTDKVPYGYNYADNNTNVVDTTGVMHGMHVAGIIAANGDEAAASLGNAIRGVAPEAQLLDMKVFSNNSQLSSSAFTDDIIAAIEDSVKLGADVINMSLGSNAGVTDSNDPEQAAIKNATDSGVLCVVSAGNSQTSTTTSSWSQPLNKLGLKDTSTVGNPAVADDALSVASYENSNITFDGLKITSADGTVKTTAYQAASGVTDISQLSSSKEVVYCGLGTDEDFKKYPFGGLNGKIALVKRGDITFFEKVINAFWAGPDAVIIFNNEAGWDAPMAMDIQNLVSSSVISIGYRDGISIMDSINKGNKTFSFEPTGKKFHIVNPDAGDMSQYSSWGPTSSLDFKPEITAPGGDIYSLANNNGYQTMSGTSMAAPNVSGSEALILQGIKDKNLASRDKIAFIKNTAMNTSKTVYDKYNNKVPISPRRQGAGLIQIEDAIKNNVIATYSDGKAAASLKEIGDNTSFKINLKNYSNKDLTFSLANGGILTEVTSNDLVQETAIKDSVMSFDKNKVTVKANSSETVTVNIKLPADFNKNNYVEGYVKINSTDGSNPNLVMPYMGFYGNWEQEAIVDSPLYDQNSLMKVTSLYNFAANGSIYYLGVTGSDSSNTPIVNKDDIAFSPNGDGKYDTVGGILYLLRDAKNLKVDIVDKKTNKVIRQVYNKYDLSKNTLEEFNSENSSITVLNNGYWDGTIYNTSTGKYETAPEGEYIYRITSSVNGDSSKAQTLDLPVKLDVTAPIVRIKNLVKHTDSKGINSYELQWEASDNLSGLNTTIVKYSTNGQVYSINGSDIKFENGLYKANIYFPEGTKSEIKLSVMDYAGNVSVDTKKLSDSSITNVNLFNLSDGTFYNETNLSDGKYIIKGSISSNIEKLTINGKDAGVKDNVLSYAADVKEGVNNFDIIGYDSEDNEVYNQNISVNFDFTAPQITITSPSTTEDNAYVTDSGSVIIKGTLKEANLNEFYAEYDSPYVDEDGNFTCEVDGLESGLNKVQLIATDYAGHASIQYVYVRYETDDEHFNINFDNLTSYSVVSKSDVTDGTYVIKGSVNHRPGEFKINGSEVEIKDDLTFEAPVKIKEGSNSISVYAVDDEENDSKIIYDWGYKILYDATAPKLSLDIPLAKADGKIYTNKDSILIKGQISDNYYGYTLSIDGDTVMNIGSGGAKENNLDRSFEKNVSLKPGENQISVNALDAFGNSTDILIPVVLDQTAPIVTVSGVENGKIYNTDVTPKATSNKNSAITMLLNGKKYDGSPITKEGKYVLSVSAVDLAGNESAPVIDSFTIDKTAPEINVTGAEDGKKYSTVVLPSVNANESSKISMTLNGKAYNGTYIDQKGDYNLVITAEDAAGNISTKIIKFSIIELLKAEDSKIYDSITGSADKNVTVTLGSSTILSSQLLESIAGMDKQISFTVAAPKGYISPTVTWSFNAKDFDKTLIKDIDLSLNASSPYAEEILKADKTAQILSFKYHGALPSPASIKVKADKNAVKDNKTFLYYYNPDKKASELIKGSNADGSWNVDKDGFVTFTIDHCSDYFLSASDLTNKPTASDTNTKTGTDSSTSVVNSNTSTVNSSKTQLPKTGVFLDENILEAVGSLFIASGAAFVWKKKK